MVTIPIHRVETLAAFQEVQRQLRSAEGVDHTTMRLWFRGQARESWPLMPSLYRDAGPVGAQFEREMTRDFRLQGASLSPLPLTQPSLMFLMQHHGLPTRLLDWTENAQFALFFAVESAAVAEDACVWIMSPWKLNQITAKGKTVPTPNHPIVSGYFLATEEEREPQAMRPLAVRTEQDAPRIRAQSSVFTIHGTERVAIEQIQDDVIGTPIVAKIVVPRRCCADIKRELFNIDVTKGRLFPDLSGIASDIVYRYSSQYWERRADVLSSPEPMFDVPEPGVSVPFPRMSFDELHARTPTGPISLGPSMVPIKAPPPEPSPEDQARALARNLVLRIKETHGHEVAQGLLTRDLYSRLRETIELARRGYEREIPEEMRTQRDYFTEALVDVLADGQYWSLGL